ncbi:hypothetical protein [Limosilactobacillus antri]|nr:hypothetical protein [Limosilactobacillus antri]EEW52830.1 hypothetical protein HMPREF0494_1999 [Limosilactobacillus antri DSM 16041]
MITMKKKIVSGSLVALVALGLAGCANNSAAPSSKVNHPQTAKVAQSSSKKASSSDAQAASQKAAVSASSVSANTHTSYAAQPNSNVDQQGAVVNQFVKASGVNGQGMRYTVSQQPNSKGNYQVEVRDSNGDPNIAHLDGIYQFNPETNQVQTMNPVSGQYENK